MKRFLELYAELLKQEGTYHAGTKNKLMIGMFLYIQFMKLLSPINNSSNFNFIVGEKKQKPGILKRLWLYIRQWTCWLKLDLSMYVEFATSVQTFLPFLSSCWGQGSAAVPAAADIA